MANQEWKKKSFISLRTSVSEKMSKFEEFLEDNFKVGKESLDGTLEKRFMARAWNGALKEIERELEIHDTMGDIKYAASHLKVEIEDE